MNFIHKEQKGWHIFEVHGELSFSAISEVDELGNEVKSLIKKGEYRFIFDLTDVPFIDSSGIAIVIMAMSIALKNGKPIKICGLQKEPANSFNIIKVDFGIKNYHTLDEALAEAD